MAKVYYNRMLLGTGTYDVVPSKYKDAVLELGKADVRSGRLTVEQFEMLFKIEYVA